MKFKIFIFIGFSLFVIGNFNLEAYAEELVSQDNSIEDYYSEQLQLSGADDLWKNLPNSTKKSFENIGVYGINWKNLINLKPDSIFKEIFRILKQNSFKPFTALYKIIGIMLLCALVDGLKLSFGEKPLGGVISLLSILIICSIIIDPIVSCIIRTSDIIHGASNFMLCYIPVMVGIMISSGQSFSAASYNMLMLGVSEIVSQISAQFLVPMLNIFLALSVVSSISLRLDLAGICNFISSALKWILGIIMTIFVGIMTIQGIVSVSADSVGTKALKFAISSFVPVVGGAISDAFNTVQGCLRLLKSGVGSFGILALVLIFLPLLLECSLWAGSLSLCAAIGDFFSLSQIAKMLRTTNKVLGIVISLIICCMVLLIVSTVIVLTIGGGSS